MGFMNVISEFLAISASIIQGTGIGLVLLAKTAFDLKEFHCWTNFFLRWWLCISHCDDDDDGDDDDGHDAYLIVSASQSHTIELELLRSRAGLHTSY